jgi:hypothetical protein
MAIVKFSRVPYKYILESEREGYWDNRIKESHEELKSLLEKMPASDRAFALNEAEMKELSDSIDDAREQLKTIEKLAASATERLEKYGPAIWEIHSLTKKDIYKIKGAHPYEYKLDKKSLRMKSVGTQFLEYTDIVALEIVDKGLDGVENLRDAQGNIIEFSKETKEDILNGLDDFIIKELANEMSGVVKEQEIKN